MAAAPPQSLQRGINDPGIVNWINKLVNAQYDKVLTQLEFLLSINYFHFIASVVGRPPTNNRTFFMGSPAKWSAECVFAYGWPREESVLWWIEGSSIPLPCTSLDGYLIYMFLATTTRTCLGSTVFAVMSIPGNWFNCRIAFGQSKLGSGWVIFFALWPH